MTGLVIKSTGSNYQVLVDGDVVPCKVKGVFRIKGSDATNPVVVGDRVELEMPGAHDTGWITSVRQRKNYIIRKATKLSKQVQVIAANLDLALVIATPAFPRTSTGFIDRFLATAEAYSIPAGIVFNKMDLFDEDVRAYIDELVAVYEPIGYRCFVIAAVQPPTLASLQAAIRGKTVLLTGHSGTGKSTLINALVPGLKLKTSALSEAHLKGTHTTTFAEMHPLPGGGYVVDTPGIREFGVVEFNPAEVSHFFPEIFRTAPQCKFYNCTHINEKDCAVLKAVTDGRIAASRYNSYVSIFHNEDVFN